MGGLWRRWDTTLAHFGIPFSFLLLGIPGIQKQLKMYVATHFRYAPMAKRTTMLENITMFQSSFSFLCRLLFPLVHFR